MDTATLHHIGSPYIIYFKKHQKKLATSSFTNNTAHLMLPTNPHYYTY